MLSADLAWVYGAALRASANEQSAAEAAREALGEPGEQSRRTLMARAVSNALQRSPAQPLDALPPPEREAIGLARILGMSVDEIAAHVGCEARDVKSRMRAGLERLTGVLPVAETS